MTIYLKSPTEGLDKLGQTLAGIIPKIGNPNYEAQQALKAAMARDPTIRQKLINMETQTPGTVEKVYGRQMLKYVENGVADVETQMELAMRNSPELQDAFKDPLKMQTLLKTKLGISTSLDIKGQQATVTAQTEEARAAPKVADARISSATTQISENEIKANDLKSLPEIRRIIGKGSIYQIANAKNSPLSQEQKEVIFRSPELYRQYATEADEKWKGVEVDMSRQRLRLEQARERRMINENDFTNQMKRLDAQQEYARAAKVVDKTNGKIDIKTARTLISTPGMIESMLALKEEPRDEEGKKWYNAAKVIKRVQDMETGNDLAEVRKQFDIRYSEDMGILRSNERTPPEKEAALGRLNSAAKTSFAEFPGSAPNFRYDDKNPAVGEGKLPGKDKTFYEAPTEETPATVANLSERGQRELTTWQALSPAARKARFSSLSNKDKRIYKKLLDVAQLKYD